MFYVNNEQVKGIFLNGRNYNYIAYGFGKIIPEDRNSVQLNLNLAYKYLNQYRIEFRTVKDGYENALVSPRFDKPDSKGVFHTPFTYYYNGNIIPTKEVDILITNGNYALSNALVYNDMNINGAINYFATNTDFQGHNVNVFPEKDNYQSSPLLNCEVLNNCSNFDLNINTRFSKASYPTLYNCNNFSGNFRYVGNSDSNYLGFRGFLEDCKDGIFNIDCTNMHGGGSSANVRNYFNFFGIQGCSNIKLNITGSSWQVWPHDHSFTSNCNINTYNVISGFSYMNDCNFNVVLPKDSKPEMSQGFGFLNNAENCNYNLQALDSNLYNYRIGAGYKAFFDGLNNCNLNLQINNTVEFGDNFGGNFNHCNIVFDNIKGNLVSHNGWWNLRNCNISGNVEASSSSQGFLERCDAINVNLDVSKSSRILPIWGSGNVKGNIVCGDTTYISYSTYVNLKVSMGNLIMINVEHSRFNLNRTNVSVTNLNNCMFEIYNSHDFEANGVSNSNFNMRNSVGTAVLKNLNNVDFVERGGANYTITNIYNCYNTWIYANSLDGPVDSVYNTRLELKNNNPHFWTWNVNNCEITGFPTSAAYTTNCIFRPLNIKQVGLRNSEIGTWYNLWPHRTRAGIRSMDNMSYCRIDASAFINSGDTSGANNLQTSLENHYNDVTVITDDANSRLTVSCNLLRLGLRPAFQQFVVAGFVDSSISTNDIFPFVSGTGPSNAGAKVGTNTRIYCENHCDVPFYSDRIDYSSRNQPIVLLNDYSVTNREMYRLSGGLYRFGTLSNTPYLNINNGACVFINNTGLSSVNVDNALLFIGNNVSLIGDKFVTNGGLIVNRENWGSQSGKVWGYLGREHLCWNIWDSGPWGSSKLIDFCIWV